RWRLLRARASRRSVRLAPLRGLVGPRPRAPVPDGAAIRTAARGRGVAAQQSTDPLARPARGVARALRTRRTQAVAPQVGAAHALSRMAADDGARRPRADPDTARPRSPRLPPGRAVRSATAQGANVHCAIAGGRRRGRLAATERPATRTRAAVHPLPRRLRRRRSPKTHARHMSSAPRVAIVGGGPAGSLLAILLALSGVLSIVIERRSPFAAGLAGGHSDHRALHGTRFPAR